MDFDTRKGVVMKIYTEGEKLVIDGESQPIDYSLEVQVDSAVEVRNFHYAGDSLPAGGVPPVER